ncbi:MAG: hypothetical protein IPO03_02105 [Bacteroidetes bacterium]|nr:hypothetical protein [Bacteroidota bacterium]
MTWLEDGFVNIYSQGVLETSATNNANKLGLFLTNFPATLQAVNEIGQAKFLKWIVVHPYKTEAVSSSVVQLKEASNGFVFAFILMRMKLILPINQNLFSLVRLDRLELLQVLPLMVVGLQSDLVVDLTLLDLGGR